jgi:hypothetical protein
MSARVFLAHGPDPPQSVVEPMALQTFGETSKGKGFPEIMR